MTTMADRLYRPQAEVVFNHALPGGHGRMRLLVGELAALARPGHFVHLQCDPSLTLPRPFSLLDADPDNGTVDLFYRIVGRGTEFMAAWRAGERTTLLMPVGRCFASSPPGADILLIAGGAGMAPLHFLARRLGMPCTFLWGIETELPMELPFACRLASRAAFPGRFQGFVTELAARHVTPNTYIYACGPHPMLQAVSRLGPSGQVSLEERMACGFGGCAACVAPIRDPQTTSGWQYRKICSDGPVFSIGEVAWEHDAPPH
ncbi:MAG: dihydroorotate dehydrogenase electron transfer subunit [Magnetococcales bacterium]|nr:dihydroorotate dehydrogenase electron transfer subunit [Magnetococcales bacterium]